MSSTATPTADSRSRSEYQAWGGLQRDGAGRLLGAVLDRARGWLRHPIG